MEKEFWISYKIHADSTYQKRYNDFISKIDDVSLSQWENDTTSFHIIESDYTIDVIANHLYKALLPSDNFLIRKMNLKAARYFGQDSDFEELKKFISYVKKI